MPSKLLNIQLPTKYGNYNIYELINRYVYLSTSLERSLKLYVAGFHTRLFGWYSNNANYFRNQSGSLAETPSIQPINYHALTY